MQDFKKLHVWKKAHQLTLMTYKITKSFPKEELYGLTSQLRRSCSSIAANIAEGCCRKGKAEFSQFLYIAMGSASEVEYHFMLSHDLNYLEEAHYKQVANNISEVKRMLSSLIGKVKK